MKRKIVTLSLAAIFGTSGLLLPNSNLAFAQTLEEKKQDIENQRSAVSSNIDKKESEIAELKGEKAKTDEEIKNLDSQLTETNSKIKEKEASIEETKKKIEELKVEIAEVKKRIAERNKVLEDRARTLQESGGTVSYLDVLLGAQDFSDLVARVSAVTTIVEADREILKEHEEDMKFLEQAEADLNSELKKLKDALTDLAELKKQLDVQVAEKQKLVKELQAQQDEAVIEIAELEDKEAFLAEQKKAIELEEQRQKEAAAAAARAAAEAKKKAEADAKAAAVSSSSNSGSSSSSSSSSSASSNSSASSDSGSSSGSSAAAAETPEVTSTSFMWPASGAVTSPYGYRIHPVTGGRKFHAGIDIANGTGTPIVASASGTVIRSYYSSSYGNVVYVTHNINGQVYTTVYAHLHERQVSAGQSVSKGQQIGLMGSTGISTGSHLHFEIHKGPKQGSANTVDPMDYL